MRVVPVILQQNALKNYELAEISINPNELDLYIRNLISTYECIGVALVKPQSMQIIRMAKIIFT